MSDQPHHLRSGGRMVGDRARRSASGRLHRPAAQRRGGRPARSGRRPAGQLPGRAQRARADGTVHADRSTSRSSTRSCSDLRAGCRAGPARPGPAAWRELPDDLGEDGPTSPRSSGRRLGGAAADRRRAPRPRRARRGPLIEVEAEGLPLSLVRAAEGIARGAAPPARRRPATTTWPAAVPRHAAPTRPACRAGATGGGRDAGRPPCSRRGCCSRRSPAVLPHLPVQPETADRISELLRRR